MVPDPIRLDMEKLDDYFIQHQITISFLPTQVCQRFSSRETTNSSLRILLTGGDKLHTFVNRHYALYNNYGPTENTVVTTTYLVEKYCDNIPIGKPIHNSKIYILDPKRLKIQPVGVPGELCIGGVGLARGYLNNPELTKEKFCLRRPGGGGAKTFHWKNKRCQAKKFTPREQGGLPPCLKELIFIGPIGPIGPIFTKPVI
jgi:non-ribosomal peptide synthetase component F